MKNKKYLYLLFIIAFILVISCNNNEKKFVSNISEDITYIEQKYSIEEFDLCQPDSSLYPVLDSVVHSVQRCPILLRKNLIYCMNMFKGQDSMTHIRIEVLEHRRVYCNWIGKFFRYKNILFEVSTDSQYNDFFENNGQKVKFKCQQDNSLMFDYNDYGEAHWNYVYNRGYKCISYGICGKQWMDERYYK